MVRRFATLARVVALALLPAAAASANTTPHDLGASNFSQDWSNVGLITANDNWTAAPSIVGYLGDVDAGTGTAVDPQTRLQESSGAIDAIANRTTPNADTAGGVAEFEITDPVVALQGSGTADAPSIVIYLDTTGRTNVTVNYNLRDVDGSGDNAVQPFALQYRIGDIGAFNNVPEGFVADASSGPSLATQVTPISVNLSTAVGTSIDGQSNLQLRILTTNAAGSDEWVGIDDISVTSDSDGGGDSAPSVTSTIPADNAIEAALDSNITINFNEAVNVTDPWFAISCATSGAHTATVSGGPTQFVLDPDADFVNGEVCTITVTAAQVADVDVADPPDTMAGDYTFDFTTAVFVPTVAIHDIQGNGSTSPLAGQAVITEGIVTARRASGGAAQNDGYFIQAPDAEADADPNTSEGIFVFTGSSTGSPPEAVVGARIRVQGVVAEFVSGSDPQSPPLTELVGPFTVSQLSLGNALPTAAILPAGTPDPAGSIDQLERYEGMRLALPGVTVVAPTDGFVDENDARSSSDGVFTVVVTGTPRPFREAGLEAPELPPTGTVPPIPRFDGNPERIRVDTDRQVGTTPLDVDVDTTLSGLVGVVDYAFRTYTLLPDPGITIAQAGGKVPVAVTPANGRELTVGTYNLERFYDTVNDAGVSDVVLTASAFADRVEKAKRGICQFMLAPDVVGVVEVDNLNALQALATAINSDATICPSAPGYSAHVVEGNDVGGIDVGFLVSRRLVGGLERISNVAVAQQGANEPFNCPDQTPIPNGGDLLNDRPPLLLTGTANDPGGGSVAIAVLVNHLRSLNDVSSADPATGDNACFGTEGNRVREKREQQAEWLANYLESRQTLDPAENLVVIGDFNAFQFNDGYVDVMGIIKGTPAAEEETVVIGDGLDFVNPDFVNLVDSEPAAERYSFVFGGNAQVLDHVLASEAIVTATTARRIEHARINSDFAEDNRNDPTLALRLADHDPAVAYFEFAAFNDPPTISNVLDQSTAEDTATGEIAFTVGDAETAAADLTVVGTSSNQSIVADAGIVEGGSGANRTVTVTPVANANGPVTITLTVTDADGATSTDTFVVNVAPVNDAPTLSAIADLTIDEDGTTGALPFTVLDVDNALDCSDVTVTSDNDLVVPEANITIGGSGSSCTITAVPVANATGATLIEISIADGVGGFASEAFTLTVDSGPGGNDAPTIAGPADQTIAQGGTTGALAVTVGDIETAAADLVLSTSSSNTNLVPNANVVLGGSGANRTVTVTAAAGLSGTTTITLTVDDGQGGSAVATFDVTVQGDLLFSNGFED